jgi:glycosyltransferase involved in cell wall biosynthesis
MAKPRIDVTDASRRTETARPRVLLVCGPATGGMRRHVADLAREMPTHGWEVAVAAPDSVRHVVAGATYPLAIGDRPRPLADLRAVFELRRWTEALGPDLVHAHGVKAALIALLARRTGSPPVVVTVHNLCRGGWLTFPLRWLAPRATAAIAVSEAVHRRLEEHAVAFRRLEVIPNGIDPERFPPAPARPADRPFTVAFVGRLTEEKGVRVLLEAQRTLPHSVPLRLVVAGDGPLRALVEAEARQPGSRTQFLGHQDEVLSVYHAADAVVMPSFAEGHPMTALEAMACSLPVIGSRVGGLPEIVVEGETGLLVPTGDAAALSQAMAELAADPKRGRTFGAAGRRRVEAQFTEERMLDRVISVYTNVLGSPSSR